MRIFSTNQVARLFGVDHDAVSRLFDSGRLSGYRIPGSRDRRIPHSNLVRFVRDNADALGVVGEKVLERLFRDITARVLVVSQDQFVVESLIAILPTGIFKVTTSEGGFDAGFSAKEFHPDVVVVDFSIGDIEALRICQSLRSDAEFAEVAIIGLLPHYDSATPDNVGCLDDIYRKPISFSLLAERLRLSIGAKKELV